MENIIVGLCAARHPLPVTEFIYPETVNPLDFDGLRAVAVKFVLDRVGVESVYAQPINGNDYTDTACFHGRRALVVYDSGYGGSHCRVCGERRASDVDAL